MQRSKTYVGTIGNYYAAGSKTRPHIYGTAATINYSQMATDFFLETVAKFLADDCGVDAAYEVRPGNNHKWLWIYGCPIFAYIQSSYTYLSYGFTPFGATASLTPWAGSNGYIFSDRTTGAYNFTLYYYGNPEDVCVLYLKTNVSTNKSYSRFVVLKTTNILTDAPSVTVIGQAAAIPTYCAYGFDENGVITFDANLSKQAYSRGFTNLLNLQRIDISENTGKLPLVQMMCGPHYCKHAFLTPNSDMVPDGVAFGTDTLNMTEITVGGRTFINFLNWGAKNNGASNNTVLYGGGSSHTYLGLIEV